MHYMRIEPGHTGPPFEVLWLKDKEFRTNPAVLTRLLREQVPILEFVQWEVSDVQPGRAESRLPLNPPSTNQHFTHQAALFLLAADYTGGIALGSLAVGWPVVGVHPVSSPDSMSLWLLKVEIKYLRPSVADLRVSAAIEPERHARIRRRFLDGKPVVESVPVRFNNGSETVAEATLTYFARRSDRLRSEGVRNGKVNVLYELKLTSSAEMIAGVRARENGSLFEDPYAERMAGQHGLALAARFCERSPQLGGMVAARTRHLDTHIRAFVAGGGRNLVLLGVGWDMRAFRLRLAPGTTIYELDFPTTLTERRRRLEQLGIQPPPGTARIEVPIDVRTMSLASTLGDYVDPSSPLFVAWEGMSMYLEENEVRAILRGMLPLLACPRSLLWVDFVDRAAVKQPEAFPDEVRSFMRGMQILGEPFTFGIDDVEQFMAEQGLWCRDVVCSNVFLEDKSDPIYSLYRFCVASRPPGPAPREDMPCRGLRFDRPDDTPAGADHRAPELPRLGLPRPFNRPGRA